MGLIRPKPYKVKRKDENGKEYWETIIPEPEEYGTVHIKGCGSGNNRKKGYRPLVLIEKFSEDQILKQALYAPPKTQHHINKKK